MSYEQRLHPLLKALIVAFHRYEATAEWIENQSIAFGVATPLEGQWLVATKRGQSIEVRVVVEPPKGLRVALIVDATAASQILRAQPADEVHVRGDGAFLRTVLSELDGLSLSQVSAVVEGGHVR